jgi:hypothetical protein
MESLRLDTYFSDIQGITALRSAPLGSIHTELGNLDSILNFFEQYSQLENINKLILH